MKQPRPAAHLPLLLAIWLIFWFLALSAVTYNAPTFDEQGFLVRGLAYLRGENRHMRVGHPLGLNALNALLLWPDERVRLPVDDPSWSETSFHRPAELFLWEIGNNVDLLMFLARIPTVWLGLLLSALAFRWTRRLTGSRWAALGALALIAFDPNVLAHTTLTTTDFGLTAAALFAAYTLWGYARRPSWQTALAAGVAFGLLNGTKFTAALFFPFFALALVIGWVNEARVSGERPGRTWWRRHGPFLILFPLASFLTLWALYGFEIGRLPQELPLLPWLGGRLVPLAHHLDQLLDIGNRSTLGAPSFLMGRYSDQGWWTYFPVAFALKTPLVTLGLLLAALPALGFIFNRQRRSFQVDAAFLLLPAAGYFAIALTTGVNLGYRHLLPILPFLVVFIAAGLHRRWPRVRENGRLWLLPAAAMLAVSIWLSPHFLTFFNPLAGGPDSGWRYLVDSNIDWGQDLAGLASWADANLDEPLWLSYFGEARPDYYGLTYRGLDSFPPRLMDPRANPLYPPRPAPGWYAISVTNLQGVHFADHDQFAWFRDQEPAARIGGSIRVYRVEREGEPLPLAFGGGLQPHDIPAAVFDRWQTNDLRPRWFNPPEAWLIPAGAGGLIFTPSDQVDGAPACLEFQPVDGWPGVAGAPAGSCRPAGDALAAFTGDGSRLVLEGFERVERAPGRYQVTGRWRLQGPSRPLKLFVHLTGPDGEIAAQWDGVGVIAGSWVEGDRLIQAADLTLPDSAPAGSYKIWIGIYHPVSGVRWLLDGGPASGQDQFLAGRVEVVR